MSKVENNPLLKGVSGMLGDTMVFRTVRGQQQMVNRPKKRREFSERQKATQSKFEEASQYARRQVAQAESLALYEAGVTDRKHTPYVVAMSDYLNAPKVHHIDALSYRGQLGDPIIVKATDDFMVTAVKVILTTADGTEIEQGEAGPDLEKVNLWTYSATKANPSLAGTIIRVVAFDRPGNTGTAEKVI